jgi:hypothetical protein
MSEVAKRSRGAQPGNQNARKHGCYSVCFPVVPEKVVTRNEGGQPGNRNALTNGLYSPVRPDVPEIEYFQAAAVAGINDEIALIRFKLKQVLEKDPDNISAVLRATTTLGRLLGLKHRIGNGQSNVY